MLRLNKLKLKVMVKMLTWPEQV